MKVKEFFDEAQYHYKAAKKETENFNEPADIRKVQNIGQLLDMVDSIERTVDVGVEKSVDKTPFACIGMYILPIKKIP